ncbi:hypothetical protein D3C74_164610 [compost metagenome]
MKKKHMIVYAVVLASLMLVLSACGGRQQAAPPAPQEPVQEQNEPVTPEVLSGNGVYSGQADPHTVEIEVSGEPKAFQFSEDLDASIAELTEGQAVSFEYTEEAVEGDDTLKQLTLTSIQAAEGEAGSTTGAGSSSDDGAVISGDRSATKDFTLKLEGTDEIRTAELAQGEGYSLYVFDAMSLFPDQHRVAMAIDDEYYAEITKLPADFSLDTLEQEGKQALSEVGTAEKLSSSDIPSALEHASLMLKATSSDHKLTRQYIVLENNGQGFVVVVNIPQGEPSEGFQGQIYTSLNTLE